MIARDAFAKQVIQLHPLDFCVFRDRLDRCNTPSERLKECQLLVRCCLLKVEPFTEYVLQVDADTPSVYAERRDAGKDAR